MTSMPFFECDTLENLWQWVLSRLNRVDFHLLRQQGDICCSYMRAHLCPSLTGARAATKLQPKADATSAARQFVNPRNSLGS
jgi:hypothetical protein